MKDYCFVTTGDCYFPQLLQPIERAGIMNWFKAFNGEVRLWGDIKNRKDELIDYHIIHVNCHGNDIGLATAIAPFLKESETKLVVNLDIAIDYFDKDMHLKEFISDLHAADRVFGVEPAQVNLLNYLMFITNKKDFKPAILMPHPIQTHILLDKFWVPYDQRMDMVAFQYHKYDSHWEIPRMLMVDLPKKYTAAMMGYTQDILHTGDMPHIMMPYQDWDKYIAFLSRCKIGLEYRTHRAASRFVCEAAALGIPVITTTGSYLGSIVFPEICHDAGDYFAIRQSLEKLINDDDYRLQVTRDGMERLEPYSFENSKKRMEEWIK